MAIATEKTSSVNIEERKKIEIRSGDTVRVWQKIQEKGKTRLQAFEGLVLARKHGVEPGATFTVRRVSGGIGVEKIFPLYSPMIDKIEIIKRAKVRRAKLYYIREKVAREIRRQMRRSRLVDISTPSDIEEKENTPAEVVTPEEDTPATSQTSEDTTSVEEKPKENKDTEKEKQDSKEEVKTEDKKEEVGVENQEEKKEE